MAPGPQETLHSLYKILAVKSFVKEDDADGTNIIHYTQYRGHGSPPKSLGKPGDLSPGIYHLYARYAEGCYEWEGVARYPKEHQDPYRFCHPLDDSRLLWFYKRSLEWRKMNSHDLRCSEYMLFKRKWNTEEEFVSAHTFIERYKIGGVGEGSCARKRTVDNSGSEAYTDETDSDETAISKTYSLRRGSETRKRTRVERGPSTSDRGATGQSVSNPTKAQSKTQNLRTIARKPSNLRPAPVATGSSGQSSTASPLLQRSSRLTSNAARGNTAINEATKSAGLSMPLVRDSGRRESTEGLTRGEEEARRKKEDHETLMDRYRSYQMALERRQEELIREHEVIQRQAEFIQNQLEATKRSALRRAEEAENRERELAEMEEKLKRVEDSVLLKDEETNRQKRLIEKMEKEISVWNEIW